MIGKLKKLAKYLKSSHMSKELFDLNKIIRSAQNSTEIEMAGAEIRVEGFNPFNVRGEKKTIRAIGPEAYRTPSSFSINASPVIMTDKTTVYLIEGKDNIPVKNTLISDCSTKKMPEGHAFGSTVADAFENISFDFDKKKFDKEVKDMLAEELLWRKHTAEDSNLRSARSSIEQYAMSSEDVKMFSSKELSDNLQENYEEYLRAGDVFLYADAKSSPKHEKVLDSFKVDIRTDKSKFGPMWYDVDSDTLYYSELARASSPLYTLYNQARKDIRTTDWHSKIQRSSSESPDETYTAVVTRKNSGTDCAIIPALYLSLGCDMFAFGNILAEDGSLIVFKDESLPEEGSVIYTGKGKETYYKPMHIYILKKDKATNSKYIKKLNEADGCQIKELYSVQYLKKREGEIPKYTNPDYKSDDTEPNPLSFSDYRKKTEDSNYWELPDPEYPNIKPGDSWENICKIYPNHPKCKDNKNKLSYDPNDDFDSNVLKYKPPFGGQFLPKESILESDLFKEYIDSKGGFLNAITTSRQGRKLYFIPDEEDIMIYLKHRNTDID